MACNVIRVQGAKPLELVERVRRKLGATASEGIQTLEVRLSALDAYLRAANRHDEVTRVIREAPGRAEAVAEIARLLELTESQARLVGDMPLDMATQEGVEALVAERKDLLRRLDSLRNLD